MSSAKLVKVVKKILIAFLGLYLVLLMFNINSIPLFVADENVYSESTAAVLHGFIDNNNHPLLAKEITAVIVIITGALTGQYEPIFWRIGSILASLGCLIIFYKICRLRFSEKLSFLAVILLGLDPMFFSFSRIFNLHIFSLVFSLASLYFLLRFIKRNETQKYLYISVSNGTFAFCKI